MGIDLASYPTWKLSEATSESHGHTIRGMKLSSFRGFGFVIYRCTYSDDTAWANLLSVIKQEALDNIKKLGPGRDWLGTHLEWKVVEDPKLEGASVEEVKRRFDAWAEDVVGEYERTSTDNVRALPRFNFCVLVDEKCLANFENSKTVGNGREQSVFVVLVKAKRGVPAWVLKAQKAAAGWPRGSRVSEDGEEEEEEEEEEDVPLPAYQATWMYVSTTYLLSLYNSLHTESAWEHVYVRPPGVFERDQV